MMITIKKKILVQNSDVFLMVVVEGKNRTETGMERRSRKIG